MNTVERMAKLSGDMIAMLETHPDYQGERCVIVLTELSGDDSGVLFAGYQDVLQAMEETRQAFALIVAGEAITHEVRVGRPNIEI